MQKETHGGDVYGTPCRIDFSANINPLGMPECVAQAACEGVRFSSCYPDLHCRQLRAGIAESEQVPEQWIICGNGAAELVFALTAALKPKRALLTAPGFAEYEQALRALGDDCQINFYFCREENGFALGEDYLDSLTPDLDLVFLCSPNNPTGLTIPVPLLEQIARRCEENHIFLVMDECFNGFLEQGEALSMKRFLGQMQGLFILKAFTKLYAMAGLRLGYGLCSDQELLGQMHRVLQPWNVSTPAQMAGFAALQETEFVEISRAYIRGERIFLIEELRKRQYFCLDSEANYVFFRGPEDLYDRCREEGILIRDCSNYRGLAPGYFRVAVRTRVENEELLRVLDRIGKKTGASLNIGKEE